MATGPSSATSSPTKRSNEHPAPESPTKRARTMRFKPDGPADVIIGPVADRHFLPGARPLHETFKTSVLVQLGSPYAELAGQIKSVVQVTDIPYMSARFWSTEAAEMFLEGWKGRPTQGGPVRAGWYSELFQAMSDCQQSRAELDAARQAQYDLADDSGVPLIRIMSWNIHGHLAAKLQESEIVSFIEQHDIVLIQETHLAPAQEDSLALPRGFTALCRSRMHTAPRSLVLPTARGGVAALYRSGLPLRVRDDILPTTAPDMLILQCDDLLIVAAYLAPVTHNWEQYTDVEPVQRLQHALHACASQEGLRIILMGDLNGRTGSRQTRDALYSFPRFSADAAPCNTRGQRILDMATDAGLAIVNGTAREDCSPGRMTSYQSPDSDDRTAVVDYALLTTTDWGSLLGFSVDVESTRQWSDHGALRVRLRMPRAMQNRAQLPRPAALAMAQIQGPAALDSLFQRVMSAEYSLEGSLDALYGTVGTGGATREDVYTDGSCSDVRKPTARAGAGVYWGPGSTRNRALRVPGAQTNNAGELFAVVEALRTAKPDRSLRIYSDSQYAIRVFCYYAPKLSAEGWTCPNALLIRTGVSLLQQRMYPVEFVHVKAHAGNKANEAADALANIGRMLPEAEPLQEVWPSKRIALERREDSLDIAVKVSTQLPRLSQRREEDPHVPADDEELSLEASVPPRDAHRGRDKEAAMKAANMRKLRDGSAHEGKWWGTVRGWLDPRPAASTVDALALHESLKARMTLGNRSADDFDMAHLARAASTARAIPSTTYDRTPERFFSRPFEEVDMEMLKNHIKRHPESSTRGGDGISYQQILNTPNDTLAELLNACVEHCALPGPLMLTIIAGILKARKPADVPESFRLIAFQSCLLKSATLLFHFRARGWTDAYNILPDSQNGFRTGCRTNNNAFVLRCAVDRARATGEPLYAGFVEFTNAFPSTDLPSLWVKLYGLGMAGPLFDWIRAVYATMRYTTRIEGQHSETFQSDVGVMTGDTASPGLFTIYLSDFDTPAHRDDVVLAGRAVPHMEQADDMILLSRSAPGLQSKMDALNPWARQNGILTSVVKTKWAIFGKAPRDTPQILYEGTPLPYTERYPYVGIDFASPWRNMFKLHYHEKASKARKVGGVSFALEGFVGDMTPQDGRKLYMARIDPILTHGCEIMPDIDHAAFRELELASHAYLRRLLGLNPRSMVCVLYTETGIIPLPYRRAELTLRYLIYLVNLPERHYAKSALLDSLDLARSHGSGWAMDLLRSWEKLPCPVSIGLDELLASLTSEGLECILERIRDATKSYARNLIRDSSKLTLLRGRRERNKDGKLVDEAFRLRAYLTVRTNKHRVALTRLLLSDRDLAEEQLRRDIRGRPSVPAEQRLCRFCERAIESPLHALFECEDSDDLVSSRHAFTLIMLAEVPGIDRWHAGNPLGLLHELLTRKSLLPRFAKFAYEVTEIYNAHPMRLP